MNRPADTSADKEIFRRTAARTKILNLGRVHFRGGTRF